MAYDLTGVEDGSYVLSAVTGYYQAIGLGVGNRDIWIIKTDSSGVIYSSEIYDYINSGHSNQQFPQSIVEKEEGNLLIAAQTDVFYTDFLDYYLVNLTESGSQVWGKFFGNQPNYDYPKDMIITSDNSIAISGTEKSFNDPFNDIYIVKTDSNGTQNWNQRFGGNGYEWGTSICEAGDGNYVVLGQTNSFGNGSFDIYLFKIDDKLVNVEDRNFPNTFGLSQNFPNPFNPSTTIEFRISKREFVSLKVFDVLGNEISRLVNEEKPAGVYTVNFESRGLSSGIYFYRIQTDSFIESRKMIFIK
ncbi:MAG: T9SS type A sorting domain-containing protein [Ignavibacteriaceae bacterium]